MDNHTEDIARIVQSRSTRRTIAEGMEVYIGEEEAIEAGNYYNPISFPFLSNAVISQKIEGKIKCFHGILDGKVVTALYAYFDEFKEEVFIFSYWFTGINNWQRYLAITILMCRQIMLSSRFKSIRFRYHEEMPGHKILVDMLSKLGDDEITLNDYNCVFEHPENMFTSPWFNRVKNIKGKIEMWNSKSFEQLNSAIKHSPIFATLRQPLNPLNQIYRMTPSHSALLKDQGNIVGWIMGHQTSEYSVYGSTLYVDKDQNSWLGLQMLRVASENHMNTIGHGYTLTFSIEGFNTRMHSLLERVFVPLGVKPTEFKNLSVVIDEKGLKV